MTMRVATFSQMSTILDLALNTQGRMAKVQQQEASGLVSTSYGGLGYQAGTVVDLGNTMARANTQIKSASEIASRTEMIAASLVEVSDLLTKMRASVNSGTSEEYLSELKTQASSYLDELTSILNTQYAGRYLFGGGETQSPPVDISGYAAVDLTTPNTDYYFGDGYIQTCRLTADKSVSYGVTGDSSGLEKAMRALSFITGASTLSTPELRDTSDLLIEAQNEVLALVTMTGNATVRINNFVESESAYVAELKTVIADMTSIDIAAAAVEAKALEVQLQASFSAIGVLTTLNLADYLKL